MSVCNNFWHTYYQEYKPSTGFFYYPTSGILRTYYTLENCQDLNIGKKLNKIMKSSQKDAILI